METARDVVRILDQQNLLEKKSYAAVLLKVLEIVGIDDAKTNLDIYLEIG